MSEYEQEILAENDTHRNRSLATKTKLSEEQCFCNSAKNKCNKRKEITITVENNRNVLENIQYGINTPSERQVGEWSLEVQCLPSVFKILCAGTGTTPRLPLPPPQLLLCCWLINKRARLQITIIDSVIRCK